MTQGTTTVLEMHDIQSGVLRPRQTPYVGTYVMLRIDDRADGHEMLKRLTPLVVSAADAWIMVTFSYQGLGVLGVPQTSLESFSPESQQGMAKRAAELGDVGENAPEHWEKPFGSSEIHLTISVTASDRPRLEQVLIPIRVLTGNLNNPQSRVAQSNILLLTPTDISQSRA